MTTALNSSPSASDGNQYEAININEDSSVNFWLAALKCSEMELRIAVAEVGPAAKDVSNELGRAA